MRTADIIYHLFDQFMVYKKQNEEVRREQAVGKAVFPCRLRILQCFAKRDRASSSLLACCQSPPMADFVASTRSHHSRLRHRGRHAPCRHAVVRRQDGPGDQEEGGRLARQDVRHLPCSSLSGAPLTTRVPVAPASRSTTSRRTSSRSTRPAQVSPSRSSTRRTSRPSSSAVTVRHLFRLLLP